MVSSFSTPVFPPVHAHPARLLSMDARFLAAIDSLVASMRADLRAIRDSDFALCKAVDYAVAPIRHNLALLRHDLALGVGEGSGPALMCSDAAASIALGHKTLQSVGQHDGVGSPLRISSVTPIDSVPPLLSSSPLLRALAISHVQPQSNDSVAATVSLLGSKTVIPDSVMPTTAQLLPDCSASMFSNLCKFSGNEFAPYTLFRKIGAEFRQAQPSIIANTCQKELVGMSARYVFDEIPGLCCCVVLDRDICYCKGIQDKGGGSNFRPLEDSRMRLGEKIVLSDYDDNIGNFIKKKLHVWCQVPSGLWELRMIRQHWFSTGVRGLVSAALLNDQLGWINWYLVGKFVKKDFYALELFEKMSEKGSEDKLEIFQGISATFHQYATSGPQLGNELSQFKNVEFDHVAKEIQNVGVRWISLPTASILLLLFEEIIVRRLYDLVPIYSATKTYLMNAISKNIVRLREFFRPINPVFSQEIACYMGLALGWILIKGFANDEIYVQLHESVRGCDVYLVQPTCLPANENFMELLVMSGACRLTVGRRIHEYLFKVGLMGNSQVTNAQLDRYAQSEANIITGISYTAIKITIHHWINFGFAYTCSLFNFLNLETFVYSTIETSSVLSSCVRQPLAENQKQGPDLSMYSCGKKSWAIWFEDNCFLVKEMVYLAEMEQYFLDDANLSDALPLNPRKSLIAQTSYFQEVIYVVANNLTSSLNLEIEVKLLLQGDGTTPASILLFLFHGMYFKECGKSGTKPYVTEPEQQCVSHHSFSHMIGKKPILLGDMAHISVLVTASVISYPSEYADMVKTTSHKSPSNVSKLVKSLFEKGYDIVSGGTENHLVWVNLKDNGIDGLGAEKVLESVHMAAIKNNVPGYVFAVVIVGVLSIESPFSFETISGVEELEINKGYFFPQFATNPEKLFIQFENAGVLKESAAAFKQVSTVSFLSLEDKANFQGGNIVMNPICN